MTKKFKISVETSPHEPSEFLISFTHGDYLLYKTYLTEEEAQNLNSDLGKHLHDLWVTQHGMD